MVRNAIQRGITPVRSHRLACESWKIAAMRSPYTLMIWVSA